MNYKTIGFNIRDARRQKGWTQEQFAEKLGLSVSYIGLIERGVKLPKFETFIKMINLLDASADVILSRVTNIGYTIRTSEYLDKISKLPKAEQERIFEILEVLTRRCV